MSNHTDIFDDEFNFEMWVELQAHMLSEGWTVQQQYEHLCEIVDEVIEENPAPEIIDFNLQMREEIIHRAWNIIHPSQLWIHISYDFNAFGWSKHRILPEFKYIDWLENQGYIEENEMGYPTLADEGIHAIIGSYTTVIESRKSRAASNKSVRDRGDMKDWR